MQPPVRFFFLGRTGALVRAPASRPLFFMPQKPPIGNDAPGVTRQAFSVKAEIDLDAMYQRLLNEARRQMADLQQQGLDGDALAERLTLALDNLSDAPLEQMGRASTSEAFNLGRNLAAQEAAPQIREVVRTEVLDENTCDPCRRLDGTVVQMNSPEYFQWMPPNFCSGREQCRGFYLYRAES